MQVRNVLDFSPQSVQGVANRNGPRRAVGLMFARRKDVKTGGDERFAGVIQNVLSGPGAEIFG